MRDGTGDYIALVDETGLKWTKDNNVGSRGFILDDKKFLNLARKGITVRNNSNGNLIWSKDYNEYSRADLYRNKIVVWADGKLRFLNSSTGDELKSYITDYNAGKVQSFRKDYFLIEDGNSLLLTDLKGKKISSIEFRDEISNFKLYQADQDDPLEVAVANGNQLSVIDLNKTEKRDIDSLNNTVIYGTDRELLKAVSMDKPVIVAENLDKNRIQKQTGLRPVKASRVKWSNVSGQKNYYVDSQVKAVYLSALISNRNGSIVFERKRADIDYSNYTEGQLKELMIEKGDINHLVMANLDSEKGLLAASIASEYNALPINSEFYSGRSFTDDVEKLNTKSGYGSLETKVKESFEEIGENKETVFDGRYVSILNAPRKAVEDPVPGPLTNNEDGNVIYTDLSYGNLDEDRQLEASVGRYPEDTKKASLLFLRSKDRKVGGKALVASEYLHSNWPIVLATLGGGMKSGTAAEEILEDQGYEVTHLVEHRSDPLGLIKELSGFDRFLKDLEKLKKTLSLFIPGSTAELVKKGLLVVKGLEYSEEALKIYLEFDWDSYRLDPEIPDSASGEELMELAESLLPERHPELNSSSLKHRSRTSDLLYYSVVGNSTAWTMPEKDDSAVKDFYTGKNSVNEEEVSVKRNSIFFDSSNLGASRNSGKRKEILENSSSYIGFRGVSYHSYTSHIAMDFFKHGKTTGEALRNGVNSLRSAFIVYSPESSYLTGVREKMTRTASLHGNPETPKDPIPKNKVESSRDCDSGVCTLHVELEPSYQVRELPDRKSVEFEDPSSYILRPGRPITPLYRFSKPVPEDAELIRKDVEEEYKQLANVSNPVLRPLSHGSKAPPISNGNTEFPGRTHRVNFTDRIEYVHAAQQLEGRTTRVLSSAELELEYSSPLTLELEQEDRELYAEIYSEESSSCKLHHRIDSGELETTEIEVEGERQVRIARVSPGQHETEAALICEGISAEDRLSFKVERPVDVHLFAPDIGVSEVRQVTAVVENPNGFSVKEELGLEVQGNASLDLLERVDRELVLGPGKHRKLSWEVIGLQEGTANATIEGDTATFRITGSHDSLKSFAPGSITRLFGSRTAEVKITASGGEQSIKISSARASLKMKRNGSRTVRQLETPGYAFKAVRTPEHSIKSLENAEGIYNISVSDGGSSIIREGIGRDEFLSKAKVFRREAEKMARIADH